MKKLFSFVLLVFCCLSSFSQKPQFDDPLYNAPAKADNNEPRKFIFDDRVELKVADAQLGAVSIVIPMVDGEPMFTQVFECQGYTAQQIYDKARMAMVEYWRSAKDVTQLDDTNNKIIIAKGYSNWLLNDDAMFTQGFRVYFTVKIECRDNRYKLTVHNFKSYNSSASVYGRVEISCMVDDCLKYGIKKDGTIKKNIYGLSWLAWMQVSKKCVSDLNGIISKIDVNTSEDW